MVLAITLLLLLLSILAPATVASDHAVNRWKAPHANTPAEQAAKWRAEDEALHAYITSSVPDVLEHTGSEAFDAHLRGVQAILRYWGSPDYLYNAGLFHSIYGTEGFQGFSLPLDERDAIRGLIGERSEKICWIFCMVDRYNVDKTVFDWKVSDAANSTSEQQYTFLARPELGRFPIQLSKSEWVDFVELTLADWLEQVQGAAETASDIFHWKVGEAYAYRRTAYAKMVEILSHERPERLQTVVKETHADVYGTEGAETRQLVQIRTPPMSEAAKRALEALRSAGEDVPSSFAPDLLQQNVRDEL
ncbi:hypothetical protein ACHAXT_004154 [Thalassiosira profunda]